jgi:hypothetical protein
VERSSGGTDGWQATSEKHNSKHKNNAKIRCLVPENNSVIYSTDLRVNCTVISDSSEYKVLIKDASGNLVYNTTVSSHSAFKLNQ